jgi:hypothetical protein
VTAEHRRLASRTAAVALLALVVGVPAWLLLQPLIEAEAEAAAANDATRQAILTYARVAAARPALEARIAQLQADGVLAVGLITVSPSPAATAALQSEVRQLVQAHGGEVRTTQPGAASAEAGFERIEAGFDLSLPAASLPSFLAGFDAHEPYLLADRLEISAPDTRGKAQPLTLHLQVHAYRRPG